jgi:signal transduction histidine kinase
VKIVTREDLAEHIRAEAASTILWTALLCVFAGSFWAHFSLGSTYLNIAFILPWLAIHLASVMAVKLKDHLALTLAAGFVALQVYFHIALNEIGVAILPLAPVFFLVSALMIGAYSSGKYWPSVSIGSMCWISAYYWLVVPQLQGRLPADASNKALWAYLLPLTIALVVNFLFMAAFVASTKFLTRGLMEKTKLSGAHNNFDEQRIQASKLQTVGELTVSILHEINNPLTNIGGFSHQIKESIESKDSNIIEIVQASNDRIAFNVNRIKDITKAVKNLIYDGSQIEIEGISLSKLIDDSLTLTKHHIKSQGIELKIDIPSTDLQVRGNFVELGQVLVNLLTNAKDACRRSDRKKISVGFAERNNQVVLWVEDTGTGIRDEIAKEIFKPFFTTKEVNKGTGMGLYISRIIARRHRAELLFENVKDPSGRILGSRFELVFPPAEHQLLPNSVEEDDGENFGGGREVA